MIAKPELQEAPTRTRPPRVAIVHDYLVNLGGAERVTLSLHRIWPDAPIFTAMYAADTTYAEFATADIRTSFLQRYGARESSFRKYLPLFPRAFRSLRIEGFDAVVASSSGFAHHVRPRGGNVIVYCHTPPRFLWDPRYEHKAIAPAWARPGLPLTLAALRRADRVAARRAHTYLANGMRTRQQIARIYRREATIVPPPIDVERFDYTQPPGDEYLMVGRLLPHRNMHLAVEAFSRSGRRLVVVGDGPARASLEQAAGAGVTFAGAVDDATLVRLYARCRALVMTEEADFGMAPLEANASGRPVIALDRGGARETVIDGETGVLFADETAGAIVAAVERAESIRWDAVKLRAHAARWDEAIFAARMREIVGAACA